MCIRNKNFESTCNTQIILSQESLFYQICADPLPSITSTLTIPVHYEFQSYVPLQAMIICKFFILLTYRAEIKNKVTIKN